LDLFLFTIANINLFVALLIFYFKGFKNDTITYVLIYLTIHFIVRIYFDFLKKYNPQSKQIYYIDKFQDINNFVLFFICVYIIHYIYI
jgi:hypothetical protein